MSDFDDLRNLTGDDDDFSFDSLDFDDSEISFDKLGRAIGEKDDDEDDWEDTGADSAGGFDLGTMTDSPLFAPIKELVFSMNSLERMLLSVMLFANVLVIGLAMLVVTGRLG
jgi:hypothetical protein